MISPLGTKVVAEIAKRTDSDEKIVMRAFLTVGLLHQQELMKQIEMLRGTNEELVAYLPIIELEAG